jgi:hypothetical protein
VVTNVVKFGKQTKQYHSEGGYNMKFGKLTLAALSAAILCAAAVFVIAQSGGFLNASPASSSYQLTESIVASAGDTLTPQLVDSGGAVGWSGGNGGGIVYVPAVAPDTDSADGSGGGRVYFTELQEGETATVGVLFEAFTAENSETGFAAGGATVEITRESSSDFKLQIFQEQSSGQQLLMLSNNFSLTPEEQEDISSGGSVTTETTNNAGDNPFRLANMTLTFADRGSVIMGQIHFFSPE